MVNGWNAIDLHFWLWSTASSLILCIYKYKIFLVWEYHMIIWFTCHFSHFIFIYIYTVYNTYIYILTYIILPYYHRLCLGAKQRFSGKNLVFKHPGFRPFGNITNSSATVWCCLCEECNVQCANSTCDLLTSLLEVPPSSAIQFSHFMKPSCIVVARIHLCQKSFNIRNLLPTFCHKKHILWLQDLGWASLKTILTLHT